MKEELEAALASALSDAKAAAAISEREQSGRTEAEFRAGTISENLNIELEAERAKATGLEEKMRMLEKVCAGSGSGVGLGGRWDSKLSLYVSEICII